MRTAKSFLWLVALGVVLSCAAVVWGTESRIATVGNNPLFLRDDIGMFTFPSTAVDYRKHIFAEHLTNGGSGEIGVDQRDFFGGPISGRVGIVTNFVGQSALGVFIGQQEEHFRGPLFPVDQPQTRFNLIYGKEMSKVTLGLNFNFSGVKTESRVGNVPTGTLLQDKAGTFGFGAGLGVPLTETQDLQVAGHIELRNFSSDTGNVTVRQDDGNWSLLFLGRDFIEYNDMVTLVPAGQVEIFNEKSRRVPGPQPDTAHEIKGTNWQFGLGCNVQPNEKVLINSAVGVRGGSSQHKIDQNLTEAGTSKTSFFTIPFALLGMDVEVKKGLDFRAGATKEIRSDKNNILNTKNTDTDFTYAIGAAVRLGDVTFDTRVANTFLNNGPYLLSGQTTFGGMFPQVSFTYAWK